MLPVASFPAPRHVGVLLTLAFLAVLPVLSLRAMAGDVLSDAVRPDGKPWAPDSDRISRSVFEAFDSSAVPPHIRPAFENLSPGSRPRGFRPFLFTGLTLIVLSVAGAVFWRRHHLARLIREARFRLPDDWLPMAFILAAALTARLVAAWALDLHGSEWGSVELRPHSRIPDILFNGYEVLTNPPLLNFIEHFVFPVSTAPFAFRLPVVFFGLALTWGARCAGRELFSRRAGLLGAAFVALNCGLIIWSATMRAYLPVITLVVAAIPGTFRMASGRGRDRDAVALAVFGALALWTHYVAALWLFGLYLLAAWGRRRDPRGLIRILASGLFTLFAFAPLLPFFFADLGSKQASMLPPGYASDLLAIATGLPAGLGLLVPAALVGTRFWRSPGALWLSLLVGSYLALNLATTGIIHWEVSYSVGLGAVVMILLAGALDSSSLARGLSGLAAVLLAASSLLVAFGPDDSVAIADAKRPFVWRSVSNRRFADTIRNSPGRGVAGDGRTVVLVTPAYESEPYLFYLGPVTPEEAGVEPVVVRNFDEMRFDTRSGPTRPSTAFTLIGFERYWSWHLGQWPELERFRARFGAFWYARLQQNCANRTGFTYSQWDCAWLDANCRLVESTAEDELYLCGDDGSADNDPS